MVIIFTNYLLFQRAETALLGEKANKLFGIAKHLDLCLPKSFDDILMECGLTPEASWKEKLKALNTALAPVTDMVAKSFNGVGVGYYSKVLDAIVTYGPSNMFASKIGLPVHRNHVGKRCMQNRKEIIDIGSMIRGEIMNCVMPIVRDGEVIGFIFANETLEDIYEQMAKGGMNIFFSPNVEPLLGLTGMLMLASNVLLTINRYKIDKYLPDFQQHMVGPFASLVSYIKFFINSLNLCIIVSDNKGIIQFCSNKLDAWGLINPDDFKGKPLNKAFKMIGFTEGTQMLANLAANPEKPFQFTTTALRGKDLNVIITPLRGGEELPVGTVTIFENLSNAEKEETRLLHMEGIAVTEQLAAALAHEIRNPLMILRGAVNLIPERLEDKEYLNRFSNVALTEINRMDKITNSLLQLTRYTEPQFMQVNIHQVLSRTVELVEPLASQQNVVIIQTYEVSNPVLNGDPEYLQQAFLNLFLNALQAMPEGGCLNITTSGEPNSRVIYIKISDTGPGVADELKEKVFRLFFTTKKHGTGLGLPLVQSIIYRHQGLVLLDSELKRGTTFTIVLPRNLIQRKTNLKNRRDNKYEYQS
jgi:two-component system sensor histidine kinase AtoS